MKGGAVGGNCADCKHMRISVRVDSGGRLIGMSEPVWARCTMGWLTWRGAAKLYLVGDYTFVEPEWDRPCCVDFELDNGVYRELDCKQ